jgi:putative hemolysin
VCVINEVLIILGLILLNGVFAGAEIAILSLRRTRLQELVEEGSRAAAAVARLRESPETFLATVQIGITVVSSTAGVFGGAAMASEVAPWFSMVPQLAPYADQLALGTVVALVSYLSLVLGELVPKSLALRAGESYALGIGAPLATLAWAARPLVAVLTASSNLFLRFFGDSTTFAEARLSREEIQQIVDEAASAGSVDAHAGEIASRALEFSSLDAYTVMIPRAEIMTCPRSLTRGEWLDLARRTPHSRLPVWEGTPDNVVGVVRVRDVLGALWPDADGGSAATPVDLGPHLLPVPFVPDSMPATAVLRKMQRERSHLALVIDEQGTIVGLLTIEDLVEEVFGDILSERERPDEELTREPDGAWRVAGRVPIHKINRDLGLELPEGDFSTIAGLCLSLAGQLPPRGAVLHTEDGVSLEILDVTPRAIVGVRLRRVGDGHAAQPEGAGA